MPTNRSRDEYRNIAPIYDPVLDPFLASIRRDVSRIVRERRFRNVLDLCCGTGRQAVLLDRSGIRVTGVDLSPAMLSRARRNSPPGIEYYEEDATALHFPGGSFDCVILSFALHEKEPEVRAGIMREARRVLMRGGRMIIVDYLVPRGLGARLAMGLIHAVERAAGARHYRSFRQFLRSGGLEGLVRDAGLFPLFTIPHYLGAVGIVSAEWRVG